MKQIKLMIVFSILVVTLIMCVGSTFAMPFYDFYDKYEIYFINFPSQYEKAEIIACIPVDENDKFYISGDIFDEYHDTENYMIEDYDYDTFSEGGFWVTNFEKPKILFKVIERENVSSIQEAEPYTIISLNNLYSKDYIKSQLNMIDDNSKGYRLYSEHNFFLKITQIDGSEKIVNIGTNFKRTNPNISETTGDYSFNNTTNSKLRRTIDFSTGKIVNSEEIAPNNRSDSQHIALKTVIIYVVIILACAFLIYSIIKAIINKIKGQ
jgi:hypothetical protein